MELLTVDLPAKHKIFFIGDLHEGTILKHKEGVQTAIEAVLKEKNNYVVIMGDLAEAITLDDPRFAFDVIDHDVPTPLLQYKSVVEELMPLKGRILTILIGNHDWKLCNVGNFVKNYVCKELDTPYGTYSAKIRVRTNNHFYKMFVTHGARGISSVADDPIRRESNMKLMLKRRLYQKAGDCIIMAQGHTHKLIVAEPLTTLYLTDDGRKVKQRYTKMEKGEIYIHPDHRWYLSTGSFLKLYEIGVSGYAERFGYDPVELGYCVAEIDSCNVVNVEKVVI